MTLDPEQKDTEIISTEGFLHLQKAWKNGR